MHSIKISDKFLLFVIIVLLLIFLFNPVWVYSAQKGDLLQEWFLPRKDKKQDIIGLRVVNNPQNYSVMQWYRQQRFLGGNPQTTIVDGYQAIRDGRTVYVNGTNIDSAKNLKLYIYLISYNEGADEKTIEIFNRLLKNWRFNINITDDIEREQIRRDTIKLVDFAYLKSLIENYKTRFGTYPLLKSGSYIKGMSVSTWPSWQNSFAKDLGVASLPIHPVNKLGQCVSATTDSSKKCWADPKQTSCDGYNKITCWNEVKQKFSGPVVDRTIEFPNNSNVYYYKTNADGTEYLLGVMTEYSGWVYENKCVSNVLTNVDFEKSSSGDLPDGWSGGGQAHSSVTLSNSEFHSGQKSIKIHQDPNKDWPGKCSQEICEFADPDYCDFDPPYTRRKGEDLCWPHTNNVMWAYLGYNIAPLNFQIGKKYRIQFYYKGKSAADIGVYITASLGWDSLCTDKSPIYYKNGTCTYGSDCSAQSGYCCVYAPAQTKCYESISGAPIIKGNYSNWQKYTQDFIYTEETNSHVDSSGNKINSVGLSIGYNNTGPEGTDLYIDDFTVGPVPDSYTTCSWANN